MERQDTKKPAVKVLLPESMQHSIVWETRRLKCKETKAISAFLSMTSRQKAWMSHTECSPPELNTEFSSDRMMQTPDLQRRLMNSALRNENVMTGGRRKKKISKESSASVKVTQSKRIRSIQNWKHSAPLHFAQDAN